MTPLETINAWIEVAAAKRLVPHLRHFFIARDMLEGEIKCPQDSRTAAVEFIQTQTKDSIDKHELVRALRARL